MSSDENKRPMAHTLSANRGQCARMRGSVVVGAGLTVRYPRTVQRSKKVPLLLTWTLYNLCDPHPSPAAAIEGPRSGLAAGWRPPIRHNRGPRRVAGAAAAQGRGVGCVAWQSACPRALHGWALAATAAPGAFRIPVNPPPSRALDPGSRWGGARPYVTTGVHGGLRGRAGTGPWRWLRCLAQRGSARAAWLGLGGDSGAWGAYTPVWSCPRTCAGPLASVRRAWTASRALDGIAVHRPPPQQSPPPPSPPPSTPSRSLEHHPPPVSPARHDEHGAADAGAGSPWRRARWGGGAPVLPGGALVLPGCWLAVARALPDNVFSGGATWSVQSAGVDVTPQGADNLLLLLFCWDSILVPRHGSGPVVWGSGSRAKRYESQQIRRRGNRVPPRADYTCQTPKKHAGRVRLHAAQLGMRASVPPPPLHPPPPQPLRTTPAPGACHHGQRQNRRVVHGGRAPPGRKWRREATTCAPARHVEIDPCSWRWAQRPMCAPTCRPPMMQSAREHGRRRAAQ